MYNNTVTGTAYVTSGTISWTAENQKGEYVITEGDASVLNVPDKAEKIYVNGQFTGYKLTSTDNDGNTVTTTYTITHSDASGMTDEQRKELAMQALMRKTGKSKTELEAAGYTNIRLDNASIVTWTVTQTTQTTTTTPKDLNETLTFEGDTTDWTIAGDTLTYGDDVYKMKDGKFTRTAIEDGKTVTYTATEQTQTNEKLTDDEAKAMLAKKFGVAADAITLNADRTTATFTKDGAPVTVNCTNLKSAP